jgi:hypothetical protein
MERRERYRKRCRKRNKKVVMKDSKNEDGKGKKRKNIKNFKLWKGRIN